ASTDVTPMVIVAAANRSAALVATSARFMSILRTQLYVFHRGTLQLRKCSEDGRSAHSHERELSRQLRQVLHDKNFTTILVYCHATVSAPGGMHLQCSPRH